jgi:hypothetical protein
MPSHKFKVGDIVTFTPAASRYAPGGVFEVVKLLRGGEDPHWAGKPSMQYLIKSANEPHQRVARESELIKA